LGGSGGWNGLVADRAGCYIIIYNTKEARECLCTEKERARAREKDVLYMCTARDLWASDGSEGGVLCGREFSWVGRFTSSCFFDRSMF